MRKSSPSITNPSEADSRLCVVTCAFTLTRFLLSAYLIMHSERALGERLGCSLEVLLSLKEWKIRVMISLFRTLSHPPADVGTECNEETILRIFPSHGFDCSLFSPAPSQKLEMAREEILITISLHSAQLYDRRESLQNLESAFFNCQPYS